jgi:hypothetical protein
LVQILWLALYFFLQIKTIKETYCQLLAYADDVNQLGDNIDTIKKNTETFIDASKGIGIEINVEKTRNMLLSHQQNAGQNRDVKIANRSLKMCPLERDPTEWMSPSPRLKTDTDPVSETSCFLVIWNSERLTRSTNRVLLNRKAFKETLNQILGRAEYVERLIAKWRIPRKKERNRNE